MKKSSGPARLSSLCRPLFPSAPTAARPALYESRCIGCHSIEDNRAGPAHKGVFGRKAGMAKGFDYSPALKSSKLIWRAHARSLATNPEATIPGQKMGFSVRPFDRADIIEYLRTAK